MEIGLYWSHLWSKRSLVSIYKVYLTRGFNFASLIKPTCEIYFIYTYSFPFRPFVSPIKADLHAVKVHYFIISYVPSTAIVRYWKYSLNSTLMSLERMVMVAELLS